MNADDYLVQVQTLLPPGAAWTRERNANLSQLLAALSQEFARIDARAQAVVIEAVAQTTNEMLPDFERVFGLPELCLYSTPQTVAQRRASLVTKMNSVDDLTKQFFIGLAAQIGYTVTIDENVDGSPFKWRVNSAGTTISDFTVGSSVAGDPLRTWGDRLLECTINRYVPAHTRVVFAYLVLQPASILSSAIFGRPTITNP